LAIFFYHCWIFPSVATVLCKELLRNAAKARIARMVASKKKSTDLEVPSWIKEQWAKGTQAKEEMAAALQEVNWSKARFQMFVYLITSCFSFFFLLLLLLNRFVLLFCSLFLVFFFSIYSVSSSSSSSSSFSSYVLFLSCAGVWMLVVVAVALCASWGCCFLASFWPVFGVLLLLLLQW
jgi:uncharacterized membrane protein